MSGKPSPDFLDTNVLVYIATGDLEKAERSEKLLRDGATISVQVLNELANVGRRKMALSWPEVQTLLGTVGLLVTVVPVSIETHKTGLRLAERYGCAMYDSMIIAAALLAGCARLWSEDMHDGLVVEDRLTIRNPFRD
jgi:predicted nucleic acid-binding protein